ncbi:hypothetical protein AYO21_10177 [Fonsecaea monophora]|uniref:Uncharacterized protein n=1 Tax=Fonsecaea monophora TaxID=254056 RepID=A0A177EUF6_9EURO|nr:hypothetical protein AYO21_10177 [Fonsecaea monophora]OAG35637.1 hypothetical protein AYO21_10177 [Fonsecaea monophora]
MTAYGVTGYIHRLDEDRVAKVAKTSSLDYHVGTPVSDDTEYINEVNRKTLENEVAIYRRLGHSAGALEAGWIPFVIDTLSYIHSRRVLVGDIALRNILVSDGQLKLANFGQSILITMSTDMDTVCGNDLTAGIDILHLGWVFFYSIAVWRVHPYYFFDREHDMRWPTP